MVQIGLAQGSHSLGLQTEFQGLHEYPSPIQEALRQGQAVLTYNGDRGLQYEAACRRGAPPPG